MVGATLDARSSTTERQKLEEDGWFSPPRSNRDAKHVSKTLAPSQPTRLSFLDFRRFNRRLDQSPQPRPRWCVQFGLTEFPSPSFTLVIRPCESHSLEPREADETTVALPLARGTDESALAQTEEEEDHNCQDSTTNHEDKARGVDERAKGDRDEWGSKELRQRLQGGDERHLLALVLWRPRG
eukprot:scaffold260826_cov31-Tisochrysis_lutea.AAC.1